MKFTADVAAAVVAASTRFGVDAAFLAAIVGQESGGDTYATRYEPVYSYLFDIETSAPYRGPLDPSKFPAPDYVSGPTEWMGQKTSWGVCQVMGAVAREAGFAGKFLAELTDPAIGAEYGARRIAALMKRYDELGDVASAYNAGHVSNLNLATYVTPVLQRYATFKQTGF